MTLVVASMQHTQHPLSGTPSTWPEDWQEAYEERVSIMIHDGGLDSAEAHQRAKECVRREYVEQARNEEATPSLKTLAEKVLRRCSTQQAGNVSATTPYEAPDLKLLPRPGMLACDFCGASIETLVKVGVGKIRGRWHCPRCRREAERWAGYHGPSTGGF